MKFEHKGTTIELMSNGRFSATIKGKRETSGSLDAMKKRIDDSAKNVFEPFEAYQKNGWSCAIEVVQVVALERFRRNGREECVFRGALHHRTYPSLHPKTPECKAAIEAYHEASAQRKQIMAEWDDKVEALRMAIPVILARDYITPKGAKP